MGALTALALSAGLVWWLAAPPAFSPAPTPVVRATPRPQAKAPPVADAAQVQRAFEAVQDAYADGGPQGLARANADCSAALKADPRVLDYCLAFDLFATAVAPEIARTDPDSERLAAAQAALPPGVDPQARIATVRTLMRMQSLGGRAPAPPPGPPVRIASASPPPPSPVRHAKPRPPHGRAEAQKREGAKAAVQAMFARAQASRGVAADAAAVQSEEAPH